MQFQKATKAKAKLRMACFAPSGGGKTFSALRIAKGIGGPIGVIDTERGSASKYADRFDFAVLELEDKTVDGYCQAIKVASDAGINVLVIDSMTHAWESLLEEVDQIARTKYKGNSWSAWNEGTPKQRQLVNAILDFPGHIIGTMRSKTEWSEEKDERTGKKKPVRVGLAPMQGKGIEYEFDLLMEINAEHFATIIKDRSGRFQDKIIEKPGEDFGKALLEWLSDGVERQQTTTEASRALRVEHKQAAATETDDPAFNAALGCLPELVKEVGSREALDKWLKIARDLAKHPASMPLSAALPEKRPAITKAIGIIQSIIKSGCYDPDANEAQGESALRYDFNKE